MDVPLQDFLLVHVKGLRYVSILVLMDVPLQDLLVLSTAISSNVSILVLMDVPLQVKVHVRIHPKRGFQSLF